MILLHLVNIIVYLRVIISEINWFVRAGVWRDDNEFNFGILLVSSCRQYSAKVMNILMKQ